MSWNPDTQPRKVRRFLPQLIETCSRKVGGLRADAEDIGISKEKAPSRLPTKNAPSTHGKVGSELSEGLSTPSGRGHLKRLRESGHYEPTGHEQLRDPFQQRSGAVGIDKNPAGSGLDASSGGEGPIQHKARPDRPRRFTPEVIETGKRSFRRGESELSPQHSNPFEHQPIHPKGIASRAVKSPLGIPPESVSESRFSYSSLVKRQDQPRRHSFRVPDLPTIPSTLNEASEAAEPSSVITSSSESPPKSPNIISQDREYRESCNESEAKYLLSLAARSAEEQLKERALEAFPNEQDYQPVDHFAIDRDEDEISGHEQLVEESERIKSRRTSSADLMWALEHMRLHKEEAEIRNRAKVGIIGFHSGPTAAMLHDTPHKDAPVQDHGLLSDARRDAESVHARRTSSPPMLGDDLVFPQSVSPEGTLCSSPISPQKRPDEPCKANGGLWRGNSGSENGGGEGGLWMGTCKPPDEDAARFKQASTTEGLAPVNGDLEPGNERRQRLLAVNDSEFDDGFVTQIYNYLSLGYPCVARYYDYELSEVSGIPIQQLRQDDLHKDAKGYAGVVGAPANRADRAARKCMRWVALRQYIDKFAENQQRRQPESEMDESSPWIPTWGVLERKGSWGF